MCDSSDDDTRKKPPSSIDLQASCASARAGPPQATPAYDAPAPRRSTSAVRLVMASAAAAALLSLAVLALGLPHQAWHAGNMQKIVSHPWDAIDWVFGLRSGGSSLPESSWRWEVILDAGSSGTRAHVYRYRIPSSYGLLPTVQHPEATLKSEPGLSSLHPSQVVEHLRPLLEFAIKEVPKVEHGSTPVTLMATAGLRLLADDLTSSLLSAVRVQLASSPFASRPEWTGVLSGQDEGLYGWLAANYGSGILHKWIEGTATGASPSDEGPVAVVELGGASAQVTFEHQAVGGCVVHVNGSLLGSLDLPGLESQLVTNSFLGFGQDVAHQQAAHLVQAWKGSTGSQLFPASGGDVSKFISDPCMPRDWEDESTGVVGSGNFSACLSLAQQVIRGACEDHTCTIKGMLLGGGGDGHSPEGEGVTLPRFRGKILAVENFFYTRTVLSLPDEPTLQEVQEAGEQYCSTPWPELIASYVDTGVVRGQHDLLKYCFSAAYIVAFLHNGLGVGLDERRVRFTNSVTDLQGQEVAVTWALGALVVRAAERNRQKETLMARVWQEVTRQSSVRADGHTGDEVGSAEGRDEGEGGAVEESETICSPGDMECEAVSVAFVCGPEFCCASARLPQ